MASDAIAPEAQPTSARAGAALQHNPWRSFRGLSSVARVCEHFLAGAGLDRGPWLAVAFAGGIAAWFGLGNRWHWQGFILLGLAIAAGAAATLRRDGRWPHLRQALVMVPLVVAAGCLTVWGKSALVGARPIAGPIVATVVGQVVSREDRSSEDRVRLVIDTVRPNGAPGPRVRINLRSQQDRPGVAAGAQVRVRARLVPPSPPLLPGGYDFARTAWFAGISATGTALSTVDLVGASGGSGGLAALRASLSRHVRSRVDGASGTIAAAFASGDRGGIDASDDQAMRDAGLTHLLSISGLHVSAVIAAAYVLALRLLALWPWLALRVRLPLLAAIAGAGAGIFYTLLTGAEVPTIRSCAGAVLVLAALALGREPLSMRMLAVAALLVMLFWPEAVVGPSFQMSFAAAIAIVALHGAQPVRSFLALREEPWLATMGRRLAMLLATGVVIELALMPIGLLHFHRAGIYGALANVVAIPLTTVVTMPLIALGLLLDVLGMGGPAWWLCGKSLDLLLALAHWVAARPGAVTSLPAMGVLPILAIAAGGLWLALWHGKARLLGLVPVLAGIVPLALLRPPDILVSGDGRHVGLTTPGGDLFVLRAGRGGYSADSLEEAAGMRGALRMIDEWPGAQCNHDFCAVELQRGGRPWRLLIARGTDRVPERALAAACDRADLVLSDRWLPGSCRPTLLKADRALLSRTGGLAIDLERRDIRSVAQGQGAHGWWQADRDRSFSRRSPPIKPPTDPLVQPSAGSIAEVEPSLPVRSTARPQ